MAAFLKLNRSTSVGNGTSSVEYSAEEADDAIWILTSTFIIFTMQSGFGLLESGSVSAKNEVNIMVKNAVDVIFGGLSYWLFGYAFSFGVDERYTTWFNGWGNFLVRTDNENMGRIYAMFFLKASFATTATTIVSGFGLLESGSVSAKNEVNIMVKNAVDVIFGGLSYWLFGYAFSFGVDERYTTWFNGWGNFLVRTDNENMGRIYAMFFLKASFATTATTIVSGAMAERTKLEAYIAFSFLNTLVFCFPAHWEWAEDGWLKKLGLVDIAGAGSVHMVGGMTGLVATIMLKPRYGRYQSKNTPAMGSPTNAILGTFMFWWGWLGFNCGSTYGISGHKWKLAARSAVATLSSSIAGGSIGIVYRSALNTLFASLSGGMVGIFSSYVFKKKTFQIPFLINGLLGALVGITAFCALAEPWEGFLIGMVGATVALLGTEVINKLKIDDPVGCVGVHGIGSIWSMTSVGLFAKNDPIATDLNINENTAGLFYGGGCYQLGIQLLALVSIGTWTAVTAYTFLKVIDLTIGLRVPLEEELLGADIVEHNVGDASYDKITRTLTTPNGQAQLIMPPGLKNHSGDDKDAHSKHTPASLENGEVNDNTIPYLMMNGTKLSIFEEGKSHAFGSSGSFRRSRTCLEDVPAINRVLASPTCQKGKSSALKKWQATTRINSTGRAFNELFKQRHAKMNSVADLTSDKRTDAHTNSGDIIVNDHTMTPGSIPGSEVISGSEIQVSRNGGGQQHERGVVHISTTENISTTIEDKHYTYTNPNLLCVKF